MGLLANEKLGYINPNMRTILLIKVLVIGEAGRKTRLRRRKVEIRVRRGRSLEGRRVSLDIEVGLPLAPWD